ncbi:hypothetical protein [Lysobacter gummosus]|uniref:hypothetical protein n=1 Tax=Lysobacter gummosus TaxID=262324 RepID=UPI003630A5B7
MEPSSPRPRKDLSAQGATRSHPAPHAPSPRTPHSEFPRPLPAGSARNGLPG